MGRSPEGGVSQDFVLQRDVQVSRWLLVALFGGLGASCRYAVGLSVLKYAPGAPFVGTLVVNLLGCFTFGVLSQWGSNETWLTPEMRLALLTGFLGAFTTFSAFSFDTITLLHTKGAAPAVAYVLVQNALGVALCLWGMALGKA